MTPIPKYSNYALEKALELIKAGSSVRGAAKACSVPESTLRSKLARKETTITTKSTMTFAKSVLTEEEERRVFHWIKECADKGHPRTTRQICNEAARISREFPRPHNFVNDRPSRQWFTRFLKRCSTFHKAKCIKISIDVSITMEKAIRAHHERTTKELNKAGLNHVLYYPNRVANADQTFLNYIPTDSVMYQPRDKDKKKVKTDQELSVLFTILPTGHFLSPFILYDYDRIPSDIKNTFPEGLTYGKAPHGLLVKDTFLQYLQNVIVTYLVSNNVDRPFLLFVDGCGSHLSLDVLEFCKEQEIVLMTMYPNATNIIQPLDNGVFTQLKILWNAFLLQKYQLLTFVVNNRNFAHTLKEFIESRSHHLTSPIQSAFKECGIHPWSVKGIQLENLLQNSRKRKDEPHRELEGDNAKRYAFLDTCENNQTTNNSTRESKPMPTEEAFVCVATIKEDYINKNEQINKLEMDLGNHPIEASPDQDRNQWALDVVMGHCRSEELRNDLLNGTVELTRSYGVDPMVILSNVVQSFKRSQ